MLHEYSKFIKDNYGFSRAAFFNQDNIFNFILQHKDTQKNLLRTHLSEICRHIALHSHKNLENLFNSNQGFSLSSIPKFKSSFDRDPKASTSKLADRGSYIYFKDVCAVLKDHNHSVINECRFLVMALTGLRFINTFRMGTGLIIYEKRCQLCTVDHTCNIITEDCFGQALVLETKNGSSLRLPVIPQIRPCIERLANQDNNQNYKAMYDSFNTFIKERFSCTPHKVRQILPNLMTTQDNPSASRHNTGGWKSQRIMLKHYVSENSKFLEAYLLLKQHGL